MPWRFLSPPAAPLSLCQAMGWAPTGFAPPHGSQTPSFTATCQNTHLCSRTTAREINQYNTTQAARSPTTKKPQTLSYSWLTWQAPCLPGSVGVRKLPPHPSVQSCVLQFLCHHTNKTRQGHIKPFISSTIHSTYIHDIYKKSFYS